MRTIFLGFVIWLMFSQQVCLANTKPLYVALGDSITAGYHREGAEEVLFDYDFSFANRLAKQKNWEVVNLGITNLTSDEFILFLNEHPDWQEHIRKANWITLEIGANDFIRNPVLFPYIFEGKPFRTEELDSLKDESKKIMNQYIKNLKWVINYIQEQSKAQIIVLNHYYIPIPGMAGEFINSAVIESNKRLVELSQKHGFIVADLATVFSAAMSLSFLTGDYSMFPLDLPNQDFHPSDYGQKLISILVAEKIAEQEEKEPIPVAWVSVLWSAFTSLLNSLHLWSGA